MFSLIKNVSDWCVCDCILWVFATAQIYALAEGQTWANYQSCSAQNISIQQTNSF